MPALQNNVKGMSQVLWEDPLELSSIDTYFSLQRTKYFSFEVQHAQAHEANYFLMHPR